MGNHTFPPQYRIRKPAEYRRVFNGNDLTITSRCFRLLSLPNSLTHARLGVIVSKRCAKLAVRRNVIKRAVREWFRHHQPTLGNVDIVIIATRRCVDGIDGELATWESVLKQRLYKDIHKLWQRFITKRQSGLARLQ